MKDKTKGLLWGVVFGSVAGSVAALLLAPKSGKEFRSDIAEGTRNIGGKVQEVAGKVGEQGVHLIGMMTDRAEHVISDIQAWRSSKEMWNEAEADMDTEKEKVVQVSAVQLGEHI